MSCIVPIYFLGQEAVKTYNSFDMSEENLWKLAEIIKNSTTMLLEKQTKLMSVTFSTAGNRRKANLSTGTWQN